MTHSPTGVQTGAGFRTGSATDPPADPPTGAELGRTCALAVECARDLSRHARRYGELFPARPFDAGFFHSLGLVSAFGSPWAGTAELRAVSRAALWVFAVDLRIDHIAESRAEVTALVGDCLDVAGGATPLSPITRFLADLRDGLRYGFPDDPDEAGRRRDGSRDGFRDEPANGSGDGRQNEPAGGSRDGHRDEPASGSREGHRDEPADAAWHDQLARMLTAMAKEWDWRATGARPGLEEYLDNAAGTGSSFVNLSHWISTGEPLEPASRAGEEVQRYLRLLNDLATAGREARWGDANALTLGIRPADVSERMAGIAARAAELIRPLRATGPRAAYYLERQLTFNTGFYGMSDYWGEL
ncbi:terpene synthase family protein [Nonomuraea sp. CA-143628]|uniref:terpene synthase family protein n=1 Tax=Nonomuraea sp. CA-143628 TaxID=3239997 RepID=UPI003D8BCCC5